MGLRSESTMEAALDASRAEASALRSESTLVVKWERLLDKTSAQQMETRWVAMTGLQ